MTKKEDSHDLSWFWWNSDKAVSPLKFNIVHQIQKETKSFGISYLKAYVQNHWEIHFRCYVGDTTSHRTSHRTLIWPGHKPFFENYLLTKWRSRSETVLVAEKWMKVTSMLETKYVGDIFKMLVTLLAIWVASIHYLFTEASGENSKVAPRTKLSPKHPRQILTYTACTLKFRPVKLLFVIFGHLSR